MKKTYRIGKLIFPILFVFVFSGFNNLSAQALEFGLGVGLSNYTGEISPRYRIGDLKPGLQVFGRYYLSYAFNVRANLAYMVIEADDRNSDVAYQLARYDAATADGSFSKFTKTVPEFSLIAEYNFLDFRSTKNRYKICPFVFAGVGFFAMGPINTAGTGDNRIFPAVSITGDDPKSPQPCIPFGIGLKIATDSPWNIGIDIGARKTFTDYLDNFSDYEQDPNLPHAQLGDEKLNDWYYFVAVNVSYSIYKIKCPFVVKP